jgi:hypothetical protein
MTFWLPLSVAKHVYAAEYRPLNQKISDIKKMWEKKLSAEDYQLLETLLKSCFESMYMEVFASFGYGFKLGALYVEKNIMQSSSKKM